MLMLSASAPPVTTNMYAIFYERDRLPNADQTVRRLHQAQMTSVDLVLV
jgi:hypothetical protein